jgi:hypothetical protein
MRVGWRFSAGTTRGPSRRHAFGQHHRDCLTARAGSTAGSTRFPWVLARPRRAGAVARYEPQYACIARYRCTRPALSRIPARLRAFGWTAGPAAWKRAVDRNGDVHEGLTKSGSPAPGRRYQPYQRAIRAAAFGARAAEASAWRYRRGAKLSFREQCGNIAPTYRLPSGYFSAASEGDERAGVLAWDAWRQTGSTSRPGHDAGFSTLMRGVRNRVPLRSSEAFFLCVIGEPVAVKRL